MICMWIDVYVYFSRVEWCLVSGVKSGYFTIVGDIRLFLEWYIEGMCNLVGCNDVEYEC